MSQEMFSVGKAENGFFLKVRIPMGERPYEKCEKENGKFVFTTEEELVAKITELLPKLTKGYEKYEQDFDSAFADAVKG